ncbi:hypothetical protein CR152_07700 [Massilia violaceinigra]|uniref:Uncharacterized protein n=2 Tax=Massilia violaceinigra TaxID=2045208 RepID=A0A2D2DHD8_9BURK|nr:hypothetical protein CR152_07700 [Massilia violaceinigra]
MFGPFMQSLLFLCYFLCITRRPFRQKMTMLALLFMTALMLGPFLFYVMNGLSQVGLVLLWIVPVLAVMAYAMAHPPEADEPDPS